MKPDFVAQRALFPVTKKWAFFDHAAVAPLTAPCVQAMQEYAAEQGENGIVQYAKSMVRIAETRQRAAALLHAQPEEIAFIPNTSTGLGYVAEGFPWQPGDNVVTVAEEFPSNQYPWLNLRERGVELRRVQSRGPRVLVEDLFAAADARTRVLTISSVQFATGFRTDLLQLGEWCRNHNIFFCVDAIQSLGAFPLHVQEIPVDALSADSHKWLLGPEGAGIFWIRKEWLERLRPIGVGWNSVVREFDYFNIDPQWKMTAGRWEGGAYNVGALLGMGESFRVLLDFGIANIAARILELTDYLCEKALAKGLQVYSSRHEGERSGIVSLNHSQKSAAELQKRCREQKVIVAVRAQRLRVSPHCYNTTEELDRLLDALV